MAREGRYVQRGRATLLPTDTSANRLRAVRTAPRVSPRVPSLLAARVARAAMLRARCLLAVGTLRRAAARVPSRGLRRGSRAIRRLRQSALPVAWLYRVARSG